MFKLVININKEHLDKITNTIEKLKLYDSKIRTDINFTNETKIMLYDNTKLRLSWIKKIPEYKEILSALNYYKYNKGFRL